MGARQPSVRSRRPGALELEDVAAPPPDGRTPREGGGAGVAGWAGLDTFLDTEALKVLSDADDDEEEEDSPGPKNGRPVMGMSHYSFTEMLPNAIMDNKNILSDREIGLASMLQEAGQGHLFEGWSGPEAEGDAPAKHAFFDQVERAHAACGPAGLPGYLDRARALLRDAQEGRNPLAGWLPEVPEGRPLVPGSPEFYDLERAGLEEISKCCFVLVAGGLGERLGYSDIKLSLPSETTTWTCYLELYAQYILALEERHSAEGIPLAIMVSGDTEAGTRALLEERGHFGLRPGQVELLRQEKVPALTDTAAHMALQEGSPYMLETKPHGHGDVHALLHTSGLARRWAEEGRGWVVFLQDTNGLALFSLPAVLGVSIDLNLEVNSVAIPRKAKQAIGGIAKLTKQDTAEVMTLNVEYNQLEPLLKATVNPDGDTNDPKTGYSPYPGNINQLVFALGPYLETLERTGGALPEFVNPKYADDTRTAFKKPTRLECMMQEYPRVLGPGARCGFTRLPEWACFSPCKNSLGEARAALRGGVPPACAAAAEADQYNLGAELLRVLGASVLRGETREYAGVPAAPLPAVVLGPHLLGAHGLGGLRARLGPRPGDVRVSGRSTLVVRGGGDLTLHSLDLDGALWVEVETGASLTIRHLRVRNAGWEVRALGEGEACSEAERIRGYRMVKLEQRDVCVTEDEGEVVIDESEEGAPVDAGGIDLGVATDDEEEQRDDDGEGSSPSSSDREGEEGDVDPPAEPPPAVDDDAAPLPEAVLAAAHLFSEEELSLARRLAGRGGQGHLFAGWAPGAADDAEEKRAMLRQLARCHKGLGGDEGGGLFAYLDRARGLLARAAAGANPLAGWRPAPPPAGRGRALEPGSAEYEAMADLGAGELGACCFVLVAGGLGERLGYSGIKLGLPTESVTSCTYLELFVRQILALQRRGGDSGSSEPPPLAIMVSEDTEKGTRALVEMLCRKVGAPGDWIQILRQEKVPALADPAAHMALQEGSPYRLETKPHGHGDVHALLHTSGLARQWRYQGKEWVVLAQDTNGLAFLTLPAVLGVSRSLGLQVNSVAVPRRPGQAIGGIAELTEESTGRCMTVNVEYNQLEPLLKSTGHPEGDVADPETGYSPYPGNINQLVLQLGSYVDTLERTGGVLAEFVNPKYADAARTTFKKPARLECMMQDYPKALDSDAAVGFTTFPAWACFSPCKNSILEARAAVSKGLPADCAASAEANQYAVWRHALNLMGAHIAAPETSEVCNIPIQLGPMIVFDPSFVASFSDLKVMFPNPDAIHISSRSTLVVGPGGGGRLTLESLDLDGALFLAPPARGRRAAVRGLRVRNDGHRLIKLGPDATMQNTPEVVRMRGFSMFKIASRDIRAEATDDGPEANNLIVIDGASSLDNEMDEVKDSEETQSSQRDKKEEKGCMVSLKRWLGLKK